ncbi:MAG: hypothetical protein R6V77_03240, partial [Candidatus Cloacimonadaceae bacterium]
MNRACLILAITLLIISGAEAQIHRDPPLFNVSVNPTNIKFSSYDYMIGGYNATPVQVIPDAQGGGVLMAFHATNHLYSNVIRYTNLAYVNSLGVLQSVDSILVDGSYNGYPSLDIDEVSGMGFLAWHNKIGTDAYYSVYGALVSISGGQVNTIGLPQPIFSPHVNGSDYEWPIVRFGPSPIAGMRRIYVMAKRMATGTYTREVPEIAYTDFHPDAATFEGERFWTYLTIPELETWANNSNIWRRSFYTLVTDDNGSSYLCGYHTAYDLVSDLNIIEPNLDVFISDNFCADPWRRVSISAHQAPSCQPPFYNSLYADISSSGHFNAVMDSENKIHFPQLFVYSMTEDGNIYFYPSTHALRHIEFNTLTETFRIDDLFPSGASPHSDPPYTPWDLDEDGIT